MNFRIGFSTSAENTFEILVGIAFILWIALDVIVTVQEYGLSLHMLVFFKYLQQWFIVCIVEIFGLFWLFIPYIYF